MLVGGLSRRGAMRLLLGQVSLGRTCSGAGTVRPAASSMRAAKLCMLQLPPPADAAAACPSILPRLKLPSAWSLQPTLTGRTFERTTGLSGFGPPGQAEVHFPLGWGEVIPLCFLPM